MTESLPVTLRVAAIDVGTNSVHLFVADLTPDGEVHFVEKQRHQVGLGEGGLDAHRLTDAAITRGLQAMHAVRAACDSLGVESIHCAATSAVREAENGVEFCRRVKAETGIHVRIISGLDEARLIYLGARPHIDFSRGRVLLVDLGGGSTEFILADAESPQVRASLPLGHLRAAALRQHGRALRPSEIETIRVWAREVLEPLAARIHPADVSRVVGTSGTFRTLARIATLERGDAPTEHDDGLVLYQHELEDLILRLPKLGPGKITSLPGMDARRKHTLPVGAVVVSEILRFAGTDHLITSDYSLRDGLIVDWMRRHRPELERSRLEVDPRRRSALAMMERYGIDEAHARHVAGLALQIFDATAPLHRLRVDDRRLLEFAALLHDVGHHISGEDHHKHGEYLIRHTRMSGFTAPEIDMMAVIVRHHRGRPAKRKALDRFSPEQEQTVRVLAGILSVADGLDRGHDDNTTTLTVTVDGDGVVLDATTREPAHLEQWAVIQRRDALEQALGVPVSIRVHPGVAVTSAS